MHIVRSVGVKDVHEVFHSLGFASLADNLVEPTTVITVWDAFRIAESAVPVSAVNYPSIVRELRPTVLASAITRINSTTGSYRLSSGRRTGGDGNQSSHWRAKGLLGGDPAIGIMDPASADFACEIVGRPPRLYSRADIEAIDAIGWNVDPATVNFTFAANVVPTVPGDAQLVSSVLVTLAWTDDGTPNSWSVLVYSGSDTTTDNPIAVVEDVFTPTATLGAPLPQGLYSWYVVANYDNGSEVSAVSSFISCRADFNGDGLVSVQDIFDFLIAYFLVDPAGDFNNDGMVTVQDIFDFLDAYFTGCV